MAEYKQTLTGTHKRGLFEGMFKGGMKAGFWGGLAVAGIAAFASGGLALIPIAAIGGFALFGGLAATGSVLRWAKESVLNVAIGRPRLNSNKVEGVDSADVGVDQPQQERASGLGMLNGLERALGLLATFGVAKGLYDKVRRANRGENMLDSDDGLSRSERKAMDRQAQQFAQHTSYHNALAPYLDDQGQYHLNAEALANPLVREALQERAKFLSQWSEGRSAQEQMQIGQAAMQRVDFSNPDEIVLSDFQLTNSNTMNALQGIGSDIERELKTLDRKDAKMQSDIEKLQGRIEREAKNGLRASRLNNQGAWEASQLKIGQWQEEIDALETSRGMSGQERAEHIAGVYPDYAMKHAGVSISQFAPEQVIGELRQAMGQQHEPSMQAPQQEPAQQAAKGAEEGVKPSSQGWAAPDVDKVAQAVADSSLGDQVKKAVTAQDREAISQGVVPPPPPPGARNAEHESSKSAENQRG